MAARFVNDFSTTLAAALASGATTCTVTTGVPAALVGSRTACRIGTEIVGVTFTTATVWALVRESEDADRYPQRAWPAGTAVDPVLTEALLAELAGQSVAAGAATGNTLWVDPLGDDATGTPERADKPYLTITAAKAAAPAGATVVVRPGTYDEYRIEADGVILWFEPGARVINTNGILLSEPIFNFGAGTYRVYGHGRFSGGNYDAILAGAGSDWLVECEEVTSDITAIDHSGGTGVVRGARVAGGAALTPWLFHLAGSLRFERCRVEPAAGAAATTLAGAELTFRDCVATTLAVPSGEPVAVEGTLTVGAAPSATITGGTVVVAGGTAPRVGSDGMLTAAGFDGAHTGDGSGLTGISASITNGIASLAGNFGISADSVWQDTGLSVTLPAAGTYRLDYSPRLVYQESAGGGNKYIMVRLWDVTNGVEVTDSRRLPVYQADNTHRQIQTSFFSLLTVTGATVVRLEAQRTAGTWVLSIVASDASGKTQMAYTKLQ